MSEMEGFSHKLTLSPLTGGKTVVSMNSNGGGNNSELEKAYQMLQMAHQQNDQYQKELLKEKEGRLRYKLKLKGRDAERVKLEDERNKLREQLEAANMKSRDLEDKLIEERRDGREKLSSLLSKEKNLEKELAQTIQNTTIFSRQLNVMINRMAYGKMSQLENNKKEEGDEIIEEPPMGNVAILFTDVEASTEKWDNNSELMQRCLSIHNMVARSVVKKYKGYEVKTEGDSFMVAFSSASDALKAALDFQTDLVTAPWPKEISEWPGCGEIKGPEGRIIWKGLRVRSGIHVGLPTASVDPVTGRMDYLGTSINKAARIAGMAAGGQILISEEIAAEIGSEPQNCQWRDVGTVSLKGISGQHVLKQVLPTPLSDRIFAGLQANETQHGMQEQIQGLIKENDQLTETVKRLKSEMSQLSTSTMEMESKMNARKQTFSEEQEMALWKTQFADQIGSLSANLQNIENDASKMRKKIRLMLGQKDAISAERDDLANRLSILQAERDKMMMDMAIPATPRPLQKLSVPMNLERKQQESISRTRSPPEVKKDISKSARSSLGPLSGAYLRSELVKMEEEERSKGQVTSLDLSRGKIHKTTSSQSGFSSPRTEMVIPNINISETIQFNASSHLEPLKTPGRRDNESELEYRRRRTSWCGADSEELKTALKQMGVSSQVKSSKKSDRKF